MLLGIVLVARSGNTLLQGQNSQKQGCTSQSSPGKSAHPKMVYLSRHLLAKFHIRTSQHSPCAGAVDHPRGISALPGRAPNSGMACSTVVLGYLDTPRGGIARDPDCPWFGGVPWVRLSCREPLYVAVWPAWNLHQLGREILREAYEAEGTFGGAGEDTVRPFVLPAPATCQQYTSVPSCASPCMSET